MKILVQKGADINKGDYDNRTPLHLAVSSNHINVVKYLLKLPNINLNVFDRFGKTPLMNALDYN